MRIRVWRDNSAWNTPEYRKNKRVLLASGDSTCALCGHPGARTVDHRIPVSRWPRDADGRHLPGLHALTNLALVHGTRNTCPVCLTHCNQVKGRRMNDQPRNVTPRVANRRW